MGAPFEHCCCGLVVSRSNARSITKALCMKTFPPSEIDIYKIVERNMDVLSRIYVWLWF